MSQLLAWLTLQLLDGAGPAREAREALITSMCVEYEFWFSVEVQRAIPDETRRNQLICQMLRSALLLHAGDIVNQAVEQQWKNCTVEELTELGA